MHFDMSCDLLGYIIWKVMAHFWFYNPKHSDTPYEHVLVHVAWGVNANLSDYIIQNQFISGSDYIIW